MPDKDHLIDFINSTSPEKLQVEEELGWGYVRLNVTEAHRRQAKDDIQCIEDAMVELLRNSRDAAAKNIFIASWRQDNLRKIVILDDGEGVPAKLINKIFEPRVTSKLNKINYDKYGLHGRGMALYSISLNCEEAQVTFSEANVGTAIKIIADVSSVSEKANQSTWPTFNAAGEIKEGPNNIIRHCLEFNIKYKNLSLYLGTPAEILSTLKNQNRFQLSNLNAKELNKQALGLGLDVSLRNCQRITYDEISPLDPMLKKINFRPKTNKGLKKGNESSYFQQQELVEIMELIKQVVDEKGRGYFLKVAEDANITRVGSKLKIILPLEISE